MARARSLRLPSLESANPNDPIVTLDVTAKSAQGIGRFFAPSWDLVMGFKNGLIPVAAYSAHYRRVYLAALASQFVGVLFQAVGDRELVLLCYCRENHFCHTLLLRDWLLEEFERRSA